MDSYERLGGPRLRPGFTPKGDKEARERRRDLKPQPYYPMPNANYPVLSATQTMSSSYMGDKKPDEPGYPLPSRFDSPNPVYAPTLCRPNHTNPIKATWDTSSIPRTPCRNSPFTSHTVRPDHPAPTRAVSTLIATTRKVLAATWIARSSQAATSLRKIIMYLRNIRRSRTVDYILRKPTRSKAPMVLTQRTAAAAARARNNHGQQSRSPLRLS